MNNVTDKKDLVIAAKAMRKIAEYATEISMNTEYNKEYNFEQDPVWIERAHLWNVVKQLEERAGIKEGD